MSAAASAGGRLAAVRHIGIRPVDIRRFLGHVICQPRRGRTLAADRHPLNGSQRAATILWMPPLPALVRFGAPRKPAVAARVQKKIAEEHDDRSESAGRDGDLFPARRPGRRPGSPRDLQIAEPRTGARSGTRNAGGLPKARLSGDGRRRRPLRRHASPAARPLCRPPHGFDRFGQGMDRGQLSHQHDRTQCHQPARDDAGRNPQSARRRHHRRRVDGRSRRLAAGRRRRLRAPGGDADEACAKAGIDAVRDKLDF